MNTQTHWCMNETEMKHSFSLQTFWFSTEISPKKYLFISFHYYHLFFFYGGKGCFHLKKILMDSPFLFCVVIFSLFLYFQFLIYLLNCGYVSYYTYINHSHYTQHSWENLGIMMQRTQNAYHIYKPYQIIREDIWCPMTALTFCIYSYYQ